MAEDENPPEFPTAALRLREAIAGCARESIPAQDVWGAIAPLFASPPAEGPPIPALGKDGHWELLGRVGVDSATIAITDPAFAPRTEEEYEANFQRRLSTEELASPYGSSSGVQFLSGFGDGGYQAWGWVADYSNEGEREDKRIAQVVLTLITPEDFTSWQSDDVVHLGVEVTDG